MHKKNSEMNNVKNIVKKLCVFPNDPLKAYLEKGEIKDRYFNPENFFEEVHIISFTESDVDEKTVQNIVGEAKLKIYCVGKVNLKNRRRKIESIINLVKTIKPNVIRAFNPLVAGWCATMCAKQLDIPIFISLHTQYDQYRKLAKKNNLKKYVSLKYTQKFIEPYVLKNADKITIVYKIIEPYVLRHNVKRLELLYNKINLKQFSSGIPIESLAKPLIISVGNLIKEKNHQCVIKAMKELDAHCLIIGNGNIYDELMELIKNNNLENKITIKKSVPHKEIQNYYKSAKIFALAYDPELEGLPMPVIEAMASGLPVVIPEPNKNFSDGLENIAVFSERTPKSFSEKISKLLDDKAFYHEMSLRCKKKALEFDQNVIENREREIYEELIVKK